MFDAEERCSQCNETHSDINPIVPNLLLCSADGEEPSLICARCWVANVYADEQVKFVLQTIEQFVPEGERNTRDYHHTIGEWQQAVLSLRKMRNMKKFFAGYTLWRVGPEKSWEEAEQEARDNIGCPLRDASWWRRLKWWWSCGVVISETFHM